MLKQTPTDRSDAAPGPRIAGRAAFAALLAAALAACTLSGSLIPPNPIPEARPSDAAGYPQNATPINPSTGQERLAAAGAASAPGPVRAAPLPPLSAGATQSPAASPRRSAQKRAAAFPTASPPARRRAAARTTTPAVPESQPQRRGAASATARREPQRRMTATIRFTPVIGAPVSAIRPLSAELEKSALRHGVVIRNTAGKPVDNVLRGYFSASRRGSHTELVYVWDILDSSGTQLHRMQGTVTTAGGSKNVWDSVPAATMRDIARKTISGYLAWRAGRPG